MRVLVVDDEEALADVIARGLRQAGMAVDVAYDGEEAIEKAEITPYDLVVLDRQLPDLHGDDVCRHLVTTAPAPRILMLTASGEIESRVEGLGLGADDYLVKPFEMAELIARLQALARRPSQHIPPVLAIGDMRIDTTRRTVSRRGTPLTLTRKEFGVLEMLATADGRVVSAEELLEHVWDEAVDPFTNAVRITVMTLRRKLGEPQVVETVVGVGYRLAVAT
ncbi:MAG TPA: response regulator transcription factor [Thermomicrobiales bacterium]|jgi:DNA-binding response OmpR family regulator|nr:response regulator transcription factor [Thermomicrobiales bacterium]